MLNTEKTCFGAMEVTSKPARMPRIEIINASIDDAFSQLFDLLGSAAAYSFWELAESFRGVQRCMVRTERKHPFRIRVVGGSWSVTGTGNSIEAALVRAKERQDRRAVCRHLWLIRRGWFEGEKVIYRN